MTLEIRDVWPDRATYRPGEVAHILAAVSHSGAERTRVEMHVEMHVRLTWLEQVSAETVHSVGLATNVETVVELPLTLPSASFRGYGVTILISGDDGATQAQRSTALDVLASWSQAPRYGFLSEFAPDDTQAEEQVAALSRYHINIAQFYDWMWRHYELMPPSEEFTDALGRQLSLRTIRAKVAACRRYGMAAYGYAAVYGAEPEYAQSHSREVVYDAQGKPYSLGDLFYIMNLAPGNPWRERILATMREAVRDVPFDGLHLDQYGFPRESAFDAEARPCDVGAHFAAFIDDARLAIQQPDRDTGVIFNAVENWPIEQVAATTQDAVYIEVWPPYTSYGDLQSLIRNAHRLAPSKQVILAAYMKPLGEVTDPASQVAAEAATRLTSAAIWANGGFHLLMGERDAALHDPYYVTHTRLRPDFAGVMRVYYDFVTRYLNVLGDRRLTPTQHAASPAGSITIDGCQVSADAVAGTVWAIERSMPGCLTVSLINLTAAASLEWNAPAHPPAPQAGVQTHVRLAHTLPIRKILIATPDDGVGAMVEAPYTLTQTGSDMTDVCFEIPLLHFWTLLVIELEQRADETQEGRSQHV